MYRIAKLVLTVSLGAICLVACGDGESSGDVETENLVTQVEPDGGDTQADQIQELETGVSTWREHFGEGVITSEDGEDFDIDRFEQEVRPQECGPANHYNYEIRFEIPDHDEDSLEQYYSQAEASVADLGLSENQNNSSGINDRGTIYFGAGSAEDRTFLVRSGVGAENVTIVYQTKCSNDSSIQDVREEFSERWREERRSEEPPTVEDIEQEHGEGSAG